MQVIKDEFEFHGEVINSPQWVFVNFWSGWSDECNLMRLLMQALETDLKTEWKIVEVNWDLNKELALQYGVYGVPTLLIFYQGTLIDRYSGRITAEEIFQNLRG